MEFRQWQLIRRRFLRRRRLFRKLVNLNSNLGPDESATELSGKVVIVEFTIITQHFS